MIKPRLSNNSSVVTLTFFLSLSSIHNTHALSTSGTLNRPEGDTASTSFVLASDKKTAPKEPEDFRMGRYRSETPRTLKGATVLSNQDAMKLWKEKSAVFIDALPLPPRPANLPAGTVWKQRQRSNIPQSVWLPNVGFGKLNPSLENYFANNLRNLSNGRKDAALVFYCLKNCWMSWNAAKRAILWGYTNVYWYPEGTDGWTANGGKISESRPLPMDQSLPKQ